MNINWDKLMSRDDKYFSLFHPNEEKMRFLFEKLLTKYLYVSDEDRIPEKIWSMLFHYFPPTTDFPRTHVSLFYEIGDFDGLVGFRDILPAYKCSVGLTLWNGDKLFKEMSGRNFVREGRKLIRDVMDEFKLKRIESGTPDKSIVKLAKLFGFKQDGAMKHSFMWKGKTMTSYRLSITVY